MAVNVRSISDFLKRDNNDHGQKRVHMQDMASADTRVVKDFGLFTLFCRHCGTFLMVLGKEMDALPRRKTDRSHVVHQAKFVKKNRLVEGGTKLIKRKGGIERQYRLNCAGCGLFCAYRASADAAAKYLYVLENALTTDASVLHAKTDAKAAQKAQVEEEDPEAAAYKAKMALEIARLRLASVAPGPDPDTTQVTVRTKSRAKHSAITEMKNEYIAINLAAPNTETAINGELKRYLDISLDWGDDPNNTLVIFKDTQPHKANVKLRAAHKAANDDAAEGA